MNPADLKEFVGLMHILNWLLPIGFVLNLIVIARKHGR